MDLLGYYSAMCRVTVATRLSTVHSECWCASAPLAASLRANSLPAYIQRVCCPDHSDHSLERFLTS